MSETGMIRRMAIDILTGLFDGADEAEKSAELNGNMACAMAWDHGSALARAGCCYCEWVGMRVTWDDLRQHVERDCPSHPMRALERRIAELEAGK